MPAFKAAYLIHGDDHGRIAERRARLRALAEAEAGAGGVEVVDGAEAGPAGAAAAVNAMTFATGRRFIVVDGAERWADKDVEADLAPTLAALPPDTTVAFFAREEGRQQAPKALHRAVAAAGGDVAAEQNLKARDLPRWAAEQAARLGIGLDAEAARTLVAQAGERRQRLLRELEKLALEYGPGAQLGAAEVEASTATSSEREVWGLVDAVVARRPQAVLAAYGALRAQGEAPERLLPMIARRLREVLGIAERLEAGVAPAELKAGLRMSPYAADRRIKEARAADRASLRRGVAALAALEVAMRGASELGGDTEATRTLLAITA
ncbi:MAG: DNA polymerase III subunit delta [Solirubrobacteraceae bacterium]|nr:DNA polymerase III subunit delta [Solirubrobacteraceae bacterium]MCU0314441.1 DNA polymerase III subunit delta [Solirubrobacteraceae bacterium]